MKSVYKITLALAVMLGALLIKVDAYADTEIPIDIPLVLDNEDQIDVKGLTVSYPNNRYISLVDMQTLLADTDKAFNLEFDSGEILITTDKSEDFELEVSEHDTGWEGVGKSAFLNKPLALNKIFVDEEERRYYTILTDIGYTDCFISICDFCMLMDIDGDIEEDVVSIDTSKPMAPVNPTLIESYGYFQGVNSVLVGDATTGEIYYEYRAEEAFPIASTTKLMTYLLTADALKRGDISLNDQVTISKEAVDLSKSADGLTTMKEGQKVTVRELIYGALIISSNECDHAISEHVAGDEDTVVNMMNAKASELGMSTAQFYNCNGLPSFTTTLVPAKRQNRMSSRDMFKLASHILINYPEIKDITSTKKYELEELNKEIDNTNPLLYNMPEVTGLKTGTTNRSGACLVTSLEVNDGAVDHDLVVVLLGAEGSQDRGRVSELLARYGKAVVKGEADKVSAGKSDDKEEAGLNANSLINMIVNTAIKNKK